MDSITMDTKTVAELLQPVDRDYRAWQEFVRAEEEYDKKHSKRDKEEEEIEYWVFFYLQDGTQTGKTLTIIDNDYVYEQLEAKLIEEYGDNFGGIADYGDYKEN